MELAIDKGKSYHCLCRRWAHEQVVEALIKVYRSPQGRLAQGLMFSNKGAPCPGVLAQALLQLAEGLHHNCLDLR